MSPELWMSAAGLAILVAGLVVRRRDLAAARGVDKLVACAPVFIAASIAAFAPEHFKGPQFVQDMVPAWMPLHALWAPFVGCALLAAAASLALRIVDELAALLLGVMFAIFVGTIYLPSLVDNVDERMAWIFVLRDGSFMAGAWALTRSRSLRVVARVVITIATIIYGIQHLLHPEFSPGVPLTKPTPAWVPLGTMWDYLTGVILVAGGVGIALGRRIGAIAIGAWMTALTALLYLPLVFLAGTDELNEALNYVADTLLFAGSVLAVARTES